MSGRRNGIPVQDAMTPLARYGGGALNAVTCANGQSLGLLPCCLWCAGSWCARGRGVRGAMRRVRARQVGVAHYSDAVPHRRRLRTACSPTGAARSASSGNSSARTRCSGGGSCGRYRTSGAVRSLHMRAGHQRRTISGLLGSGGFPHSPGTFQPDLSDWSNRPPGSPRRSIGAGRPDISRYPSPLDWGPKNSCTRVESP